MSEHLQHDPRTKQQIKDILFEHLYGPIQKQFKDRIDALIVKNTLLGGYSHKSFMHKNVLYNCDVASLPRKMNRLVPQLTADMNDYLKDLKELNEKELPFVVGYINQVLNSSNDLHDYLRLLPPAVHHPIMDLINTCPCRTKKLAQETVDLLQQKNLSSINLMKRRMVTNLLI
jgi:hypothetical protein